MSELPRIRLFRSRAAVSATAWAGLVAVTSGCGSGQPSLVAVQGHVDGSAVAPFSLAGHVVEIERVDDAAVRGFAAIAADGRLAFQSLHDGTVRDGVPPGMYRGRLVIVADDQPALDAAQKQIPKKYLAFESSGIEFQVPLTGDLVVRMERR